MVWKGGPGSPGLAAPGSGAVAGGVAVRGRGLPDTSSGLLGGAGVEQLELAPLPGRVPGLWPPSFLCSTPFSLGPGGDRRNPFRPWPF